MAYREEVIREILRLIGEGLSQREVAKQAGVSEALVSAVETGKRTIKTKYDEREKLGPLPWDQRTVARCKDCGFLVKLPCLACGQEKTRKIKRVVRDVTG